MPSGPHTPALHAALVTRGFEPLPFEFPAEERRYQLAGVKLEVRFTARLASGEAAPAGGRWDHWPYPLGSLGEDYGELDGLVTRLLSLEALLDEKERFLSHLPDRPPRDRDLADIELLRRLIQDRQPPSI